MALATFNFDVQNMGDDSSSTVAYIVELVSCSDTTTPITANGYTFKTTVSNGPKNGTVEATFDGVLANTLLPANIKLKITSNKNGNPIVRYGECISKQTVICAEEPASKCVISNVGLGQPVCSGASSILEPYSFTTNYQGLHKLDLYRVLPNNQTPVLVKTSTINVGQLNVLQTGTIALDSLDADNYKLYISVITQNNSDPLCIAQSNITLLSCNNTGNCVKPTFDAVVTNPFCDGTDTPNNGKVILNNTTNANKFRYCAGQVWNCGDDYNLGINITSTTNFEAISKFGVIAGNDVSYFVLRVYKDATCFTDKVIKLTKPECNSDLCSMGETSYSGQATQKQYTYKNTTNDVKRIYLRFEPSKPVIFTVKRDDTVLYVSKCAGVDISNCSSCSNTGVLCASVLLLAGQTVSLNIDATCSSNATTAWKLKTSCSSLNECSNVLALGEQNVAKVVMPKSGANFVCNSNDVSLSLKDYYGATSGEYQFGYALSNQWATAADVIWENQNTKVVPKNTTIGIWVRDKQNTDANTVLIIKTPDCVVTATNYPLLKTDTITQSFSQNGNTLSVSIDNVSPDFKYKTYYQYQDDSLQTVGTVDIVNKKVTLPLSNKAGTIITKLVNTDTGLISNWAFYNVMGEETIFFDSATNVCKFNDTSTYLNLKVRQTGNATTFRIIARDYITGEVYLNTTVPVSNDIYLKHTETNKPISIQLFDENNLLKGSQIKNVILNPLNCSASTSECSAFAKFAYVVNALNSGGTPDSVGFYYKGANPYYKFYIESESVRGTYELYVDFSKTPDVERSLTGNLAEYNHRIVQAVGSRVWRDKNYKVKIEFYDSKGAVSISQEIVIDITSGTGVTIPIGKYECNNSNTNNCRLTNATEIGYINNNDRLQSRLIDGEWIPVVYPNIAFGNQNAKDIFFPKGSNFLNNQSVTITRANTFPSCFKIENTDLGGSFPPLKFRPKTGPYGVANGGNYIPDGYRRDFTSDGSLYFQQGIPDPDQPETPVTGTGKFDIRYADWNAGGGPVKLFRFNVRYSDDGSLVYLIKTEGQNAPDGYQIYWLIDGEGVLPDGSKVVNAVRADNIDNIAFPVDFNTEIKCFFAQGPEVQRGAGNGYCAAIGQAIVYTGNKPTNT